MDFRRLLFRSIFFLESLIDEVAVAAKLDPIAMRRPWLAGDKRLLAVVDKAAKEAGWGAAREGHALGFACYTAVPWLCRVAAVLDTSLVHGQPQVHRLETGTATRMNTQCPDTYHADAAAHLN